MPVQAKARDEVRRYTRRGMARAVLENCGNAEYMAGHPLAMEMAKSTSTQTVERLATERNPAGSTGPSLVGMQIDEAHPRAATWPNH